MGVAGSWQLVGKCGWLLETLLLLLLLLMEPG